MRILGCVFVACGIGLTLTIFFFWPGMACVGVGALLCCAGKKRQPVTPEMPAVPYMPGTVCPECKAEDGAHVLSCKILHAQAN